MVSVAPPLPPSALTHRKPSLLVKAIREGRAPTSSKSYEENSVRRWEGQCPGWGRGNQIGSVWERGGMGCLVGGGEAGVNGAGASLALMWWLGWG